jgi:hypothetical protein
MKEIKIRDKHPGSETLVRAKRMPSSFYMNENLFQTKPKKIGAITIRRTHRAGIYKQVDKTAKKYQFNEEKTLETTIFFGFKNLGSGSGQIQQIQQGNNA